MEPKMIIYTNRKKKMQILSGFSSQANHVLANTHGYLY